MSDWFSGDVIANNIRLHYHRTGGDGPPVVLAHGMTDNGLCWIRLARALERAYDLIMPDARGHGFSEASLAGYGPEDHAADLAGLVAALGLEKPALVGHSMGAAVIAVAAATYPDLARCAVLEDPPWRSPAAAQARVDTSKSWQAEIMRQKSQTKEEIIADARPRRPGWAEVEWGVWAEAKQQFSPRAFGWFDSSAFSSPWQEVVRRIACPALLITGDPELGGVVTPEMAQAAAELNPGIEVVHVAGAGHNVRRERFEQYLEAVAAFLEGCQ